MADQHKSSDAEYPDDAADIAEEAAKRPRTSGANCALADDCCKADGAPCFPEPRTDYPPPLDFVSTLDEIIRLWEDPSLDLNEDAMSAAITRLKLRRGAWTETPCSHVISSEYGVTCELPAGHLGSHRAWSGDRPDEHDLRARARTFVLALHLDPEDEDPIVDLMCEVASWFRAGRAPTGSEEP